MIQTILKLLKKIPVDFGQESVAETTEGKQIAKNLVPRPPFTRQKQALDIGCRHGVQSRWLESQGYTVTSIDVEKSYEKCQIIDVNQGLPFKNNSFDLVWCSEVIEHLQDPRAFSLEVIRVTKGRGNIILTTPNSHFWLFRLFSLIGLPPSRLQRDDHLHFFHLKDIKEIFPDAEISGYFPYIGCKFTIHQPLMVNLLSPTFVIHLSNRDQKDK